MQRNGKPLHAPDHHAPWHEQHENQPAEGKRDQQHDCQPVYRVVPHLFALQPPTSDRRLPVNRDRLTDVRLIEIKTV